MRMIAINFEQTCVAIACGAPGHIMSTVFAAEPVQPVLHRLAELFGAYEPEQVLMAGTGGASTAVESWLGAQGYVFSRMPEGAVEQMADALASGATRLTFSGETADCDQRPGSERTALAALELGHRLLEWSADQLRDRRVYQ